MPEFSEIINKINELKLCVIIPTYNNAGTIAKVITDVQQYTTNVIVVNDGSTDNTQQIISKIKGIEIVTYSKNKGKGFALQQGFKYAINNGFDYAITIDSDGQHFAEDIPTFIKKLEENKNVLLIGARNMNQDGVPGKSSFGNKFSNFWFKIETGKSMPDTQSGYRLYPIHKYKKMLYFTRKYEFEIEIIVRSAWKGIEIKSVPIKIYYSPPEERVSHFRPFKDFTRISILNSILVFIAFVYIKPVMFVKYLFTNNPVKIVKEQISKHNDSNIKVASAIAFGLFMGIFPVWGFQMILAATIAHFLKLNKIIVLVFSNISIAPMVPFIIYLSYQTGGIVLQNTNDLLSGEKIIALKNTILNGEFFTAGNEIGYSIYQYLVGSVVFGLVLGVLVGFISLILLNIFRKR
jgi:glycosyltransferase involved in cell wall biosynthesis